MKDFIVAARDQSYEQMTYSNTAVDPLAGANKYFGDAFESLVEVMLLNSTIDKRINSVGYLPAKKDEFGIDGFSSFTYASGDYGKLGIQIKVGSDPTHYYDSNNSNIMSAIASLSVFGYNRLLFINTGAGIHPGLLSIINQRDSQLIVQLNYKDLVKLLDGNITIWNDWSQSLI